MELVLDEGSTPVPHVWFKFSPELFVRFAEVLGFDESTVTYPASSSTSPTGHPGSGSMFTVVSTRDPRRRDLVADSDS